MEKYGNSAYFVPQDLYQKEITAFHQEHPVNPESAEQKIGDLKTAPWLA